MSLNKFISQSKKDEPVGYCPKCKQQYSQYPILKKFNMPVYFCPHCHVSEPMLNQH